MDRKNKSHRRKTLIFLIGRKTRRRLWTHTVWFLLRPWVPQLWGQGTQVTQKPQSLKDKLYLSGAEFPFPAGFQVNFAVSQLSGLPPSGTFQNKFYRKFKGPLLLLLSYYGFHDRKVLPSSLYFHTYYVLFCFINTTWSVKTAFLQFMFAIPKYEVLK